MLNRLLVSTALLAGFFSSALSGSAQDIMILPRQGTEYPTVAAIPSPADDEVIAVYEAVTGNIYVSNGISNLLTFGLEGAPWLCANLSGDSAFGFPEECLDGFVVYLNFGGIPTGGPFSLGNLLPADPSIRTAEDFQARYPDAEYASGEPGMAQEFARFSVIPAAIPEPGSGSLLLLATFGWLGRRRN